MNQLIIFLDDDSLKAVLEAHIEKITNTVPVFTNSSEYFITLTSMFDDLEMIIVVNPDAVLIDALNARNSPIKKIFEITNDSQAIANRMKCDQYLQMPVQNIANFKTEFSNFVNMIPTATVKEFISIPMMSLTHFRNAPCACYATRDGSKQILNKNEEVTREKVYSFIKLGYEEVFFLKAMSKDITSLLINGMVDKIQGEYVSVSDKFKSANEVFHTTRELASKVGFPAKVVQVVTAIIDKIAQDVRKGSTILDNYLTHLRTNTELGFRFRLAELSSLIATQIVQNITAAGNDPINKVVFACLFADMTLKDRSHVHIRSSEALAELPPEVQKDINRHALDASDIVAKSKNVPFEAEKLIKQHHGAINGLGFPKSFPPQISPLALVVFAAQEIAYEMLMHTTLSTDEICDSLTERHNSATLINYFKIFKECSKN